MLCCAKDVVIDSDGVSQFHAELFIRSGLTCFLHCGGRVEELRYWSERRGLAPTSTSFA